jgi:hypothetical protein
VPCTYSQGRSHRLKDQNNELIALLKDLGAHVDDDGKKKIDEYFKLVKSSIIDESTDANFSKLGGGGSIHALTMALKRVGKQPREGPPTNEGR